MIRRATPTQIWITNALAATLVAVWLYLDPRFEASVSWWNYQLSSADATHSIRDMGDWRWLVFRNRSVCVLAVLAAVSFLLMIGQLAFGFSKHRNTRNWILLTSLVCIWLGILMGWKDIAWFGKRKRMQHVLQQFEPIVADFHDQWPTRDGQHPIVGPFMAYPIDGPRTLILLTLPEFQNTDTTCGVIEGSKTQQIIRFELVGSESGDWIEWHPENSQPRDFISGLLEPYYLERSQKLTDNWHLVRYRIDAPGRPSL